MRCPACGVENSAGVPRCTACGAELPRRNRRSLASESMPSQSTWLDTRNPTALAAYRCSLFGLIPFLGLILGPLALVLGILAWRRAKADPALQSGVALAAVVLGALILVTNWVGLVLMIIGLRST
jgi:hypothetical protein